MPRIVEYKVVLEAMLAQGFVSLYHNSGAFGFAKDTRPQIVGWIGPIDPTLRAEALNVAHSVPPPYPENLSKLLVRAWTEFLPGELWVLPMSHWAYELDFAGKTWMPDLLRSIGVDPALLQSRNDGAAIEFSDQHAVEVERLLTGLLRGLAQSDFTVAFPAREALCTVHHHQQLWWNSTDPLVASRLGDAVSSA